MKQFPILTNGSRQRWGLSSPKKWGTDI